MKKQVLGMMTVLAVCASYASLGESANEALQRTLRTEKVAFFAETNELSARFKTVGVPFLETLKDAGFDCLLLESGSVKTGHAIPTGLTYENYELLGWLGFMDSYEEGIRADMAFLDKAKHLGYKVSFYKKSQAAADIANKINSKECTRIVTVVDAKSKYSLPSTTIAASLEKSGWNTVSYLLLPKGKKANESETEYAAVFTF